MWPNSSTPKEKEKNRLKWRPLQKVRFSITRRIRFRGKWRVVARWLDLCSYVVPNAVLYFNGQQFEESDVQSMDFSDDSD